MNALTITAIVASVVSGLINVTVIHPLFMGAFLGAAPLLAVAWGVARASGQATSSLWLAVAFTV